MNAHKDPYYKVTVWLKLNKPRDWSGDKKKQLTFSFEYYVNSNTKLGEIISDVPNKISNEFGRRKYEITTIQITGYGAE